MLCDGCKKREASVMLHMITNGQIATRSLCVQCARKAHGEMSQAFSTMGMQMEGLHGMVEAPAPEKLRLPKMICSTCRTPYEDIDHETVFGCPSCYKAFHQQIVDYLSGLRGEPQPVEAAEAERTVRVPLPTADELRERLKDALSAEDYEQAATLRDMLRGAGLGAQEQADA
ncbi:MAG: UvrB/UvrC motif-containing protein [Christensenellales bacterium]